MQLKERIRKKLEGELEAEDLESCLALLEDALRSLGEGGSGSAAQAVRDRLDSLLSEMEGIAGEIRREIA